MVDGGMVEVGIAGYRHQELRMTGRMYDVGLVHFPFNLEKDTQ